MSKERTEGQKAALDRAWRVSRQKAEANRERREQEGAARAKRVMEMLSELGWLRSQASRNLFVSVNAPYRWAKRAEGQPGGSVPSLLVERYLELLVKNKQGGAK